MQETINGVKVTKGQAEVYKVFKQFGVPLPDHALVPLAQHASQVHQSSSGIRSRRAELLRKGLLVQRPSHAKTASGRTARVFEAV